MPNHKPCSVQSPSSVHCTPMTALSGRGGSSSRKRTLENVIRQACFFFCRDACPITLHRNRHFTPAWFAVTMGECVPSANCDLSTRSRPGPRTDLLTVFWCCRDWVDIHPLSQLSIRYRLAGHETVRPCVPPPQPCTIRVVHCAQRGQVHHVSGYLESYAATPSPESVSWDFPDGCHHTFHCLDHCRLWHL